MILYHFTPLIDTNHPRGGFMRRLDGSPIWQPDKPEPDKFMTAPKGLIPAGGRGWGDWQLEDGPEIVWLSTDPATVTPEAEDRHLLTWVRLTVRIASTDRCLINFDRWCRRNGFYVPRKSDTKDWWGYADTIPDDWIVDAEILCPCCHQPPWIGYYDEDGELIPVTQRAGTDDAPRNPEPRQPGLA